MYLPLMSKLVEAVYCWLYTTTVQLALKKKLKYTFWSFLSILKSLLSFREFCDIC